jgi:hypothetical protein
MFLVLGTSLLACDSCFLHCIIAFFYSFSGFIIQKRQKKSKNKKRGGKASISLFGSSVVSLEQSTIFEPVSQ